MVFFEFSSLYSMQLEILAYICIVNMTIQNDLKKGAVRVIYGFNR